MFPDSGEWLPSFYLELPVGIVGLTVFVVYTLALVFLAYSLLHQFRNFGLRGWLLATGFCLLVIIVGIFAQPLLEKIINQTGLENIINSSWVVPIIGLMISLVAALWINPAAAALVAFTFSFAFSLSFTHQVYDIFTPVFVVTLVAVLIHLRMEGRLYRLLRTPIVASFQGAMLALFLLAISTLAIVSASRSPIASINSALERTWTEAAPVIITAVLAGLIIMVLRRWRPLSAQPPVGIVLPFSNNLNGRIVTTFVFSAALLTFFMVIIAFGLTRSTLGLSTINQITDQIETAANVVEDFQTPRMKLLQWAAIDIDRIAGIGTASNPNTHDLELLLSSFESLTVLDDDSTVLATFPADVPAFPSEVENAAAVEVFRTGTPVIVPAEIETDPDSMVSMVVPAPSDQQTSALVIGRVRADELTEALAGVKSNFPECYTFLRHNKSDFTLSSSEASLLPGPEDVTKFSFTDASLLDDRAAIVAALDSSNHQFGEFSKETFGDEWSIGLVVPKDELLASGLSLIGQGLFVFILGLIFATVMLVLIVDSASQVIQQISRQTHRAASLGIDSPVKRVGDGDEIGGLATAFRRLQMAYRQQWEEQRLLLAVSEEIATTFDFQKGMPTILNAALVGISASGARIILVRKSDNKILRFTQPPDAVLNEGFDQRLLQIMQDESELICPTQQEVHSRFSDELAGQSLPKALVAVPLKTDEQHRGVILVWRKEARHWKANQLRFLRTLASNASTLIAKAKLLASVEQGRRRLSAVLSGTADAVMATNPANRIMLLNGAMEEYFDLSSKDVLGKKLDSVLENQDLLEAFSGNGSNPARIEVNANDGQVLDGLVSTLSYNGGNSDGTVVVLRDVTRFKKLDDMKTEFVANVSHDLRSPLTQMLTYSQLIPMDGPLSEKQTLWLGRVERAVIDMKELIEVLLDLNRLEAGVTLVSVVFRIEDIFQVIINSYSDEASANGLYLNYHVDEFLPVVEGDIELIRQAIGNIVSNAIKYAPNSGDLTLKAEVHGDELVIGVVDHGPGIAEAEVGRVFEKFYRTSAQSGGPVAGRGLGLALVKSIVERHGGRTWCESKIGVGSRFYIAIPIYPNDREGF